MHWKMAPANEEILPTGALRPPEYALHRSSSAVYIPKEVVVLQGMVLVRLAPDDRPAQYNITTSCTSYIQNKALEPSKPRRPPCLVFAPTRIVSFHSKPGGWAFRKARASWCRKLLCIYAVAISHADQWCTRYMAVELSCFGSLWNKENLLCETLCIIFLNWKHQANLEPISRSAVSDQHTSAWIRHRRPPK